MSRLNITLILAAGYSRRTAPCHKLLATNAAGLTMLGCTINTALDSITDRVVVVVPPQRTDLKNIVTQASALSDRIELCVSHNTALGLSASLRAGIEVAEKYQAHSALICLGDMPLVPVTLLNTLIATQHVPSPPPAAAPLLHGRPGNPVIWRADQFSALKQAEGDKGGRDLLRQLGAALHLIESDPALLTDFDTPERLQQFARL